MPQNYTPTGSSRVYSIPDSADPTVVADWFKNVIDDIDAFISAGIAKALVDAKGDLLIGTADNTLARLAVGANEQVLTADSTQSSGMRWAAAPDSGFHPFLLMGA